MVELGKKQETDYRTAFPATPARIAVVPSACDCHTHVFGPYARFPLWSRCSYSPPEASLENPVKVQAALGLDRVVIVQPTVHGTDNSVTLDAISQLGPRARGVDLFRSQTLKPPLSVAVKGLSRGAR